jgi:CRP/FNR family cyclic AMP-dependent transcriptional regulator
MTIQGPSTRELMKDQIMCATGEKFDGLYLIHSGKLMVFVTSGTQVTPLAILSAGEYFGEMSFFDDSPRSANVIAIEETSVVKLTIDDAQNKFPKWLHQIASSMVGKLRESSDIIRQKGIRKKNVETIKPLSIDEQRHYYGVLQDYLKK